MSDLQTPRWDFDWQRAHAYDVPLDEVPTVRADDTLRLPEMCLGVFGIVL